MLEVLGLAKSYGLEPLFKDVTFTVARGERIGVLGRNGSGKTTLFRLILGEEEPESGSIRVPKDYRCACLSQYISFTEKTVLEEAARDMPLMEGGGKRLYEAEALLQGLGFAREEFEASPDTLSGGYQVRLQLARLLLGQPDLLLLDEPTNYLDIVSLRWISSFLKNWPGELMLISHDRAFMDGITSHTLGIHRGSVRKIRGTTTDFERMVDDEEELYEKTRINQERKIAQTERFIERFRAKATKARAVQSRIKSLQRLQQMDELQEVAELDFRFPYASYEGKWPLQIEELRFGYDPRKPLVQGLNLAVRSTDRIGIIGRNGRGKTTLLRLIAGELSPDAGAVRIGERAKIGYFGQTNIERLGLGRTIEEEILSVQPDHSRTIARAICGLMMFSGDDALKKIGVLSGGEKSRVLLGKLLAQPSNVLLLDEPTNHLDLPSTEALVEAAADFPGAVLVVTHSETILRSLVNRLVVFDRPGCFVFEGGYDDFLESIGWSEEQDQEPARPKETPQNNKKEQRRRRAEFLTQKTRALQPLQEAVASLEERIVTLEEQLQADEKRLVEISQGEYRPEAAELARSVRQTREQIEALFEELDKAAKLLQERERSFSS